MRVWKTLALICKHCVCSSATRYNNFFCYPSQTLFLHIWVLHLPKNENTKTNDPLFVSKTTSFYFIVKKTLVFWKMNPDDNLKCFYVCLKRLWLTQSLVAASRCTQFGYLWARVHWIPIQGLCCCHVSSCQITCTHTSPHNLALDSNKSCVFCHAHLITLHWYVVSHCRTLHEYCRLTRVRSLALCESSTHFASVQLSQCPRFLHDTNSRFVFDPKQQQVCH